MTVVSTIQLVDAIANQEPEVCLASGYYPLEAQLNLTSSIRLTAVEPGGVRIDAQGSEAVPRRVMRVWKGATVVLTGLVLTGGWTPSPESVWGECRACGGGIYNEGALTLDRCEVANNHADDFGGGLYNEGGNVTISLSLIHI